MVAKYTGFCRGCCGTTRNTYFEERSELSQQLSCHLWPIWTWASFARREPWGWTVARWCWGSSWWCFLGLRELKDVFEVEELRSFCNLFLWTGDCSELNKIRRNSKKKLINPSILCCIPVRTELCISTKRPEKCFACWSFAFVRGCQHRNLQFLRSNYVINAPPAYERIYPE